MSPTVGTQTDTRLVEHRATAAGERARPCPHCSSPVHRVHRRGWQRLAYSALYSCHRCGDVMVKRFAVPRAVSFVLSPWTVCVRCGNPAVRRLPKRDGVDTVSHHPLSVIMGLLGAPWRHCDRCRLQFRDWRPTTR